MRRSGTVMSLVSVALAVPVVFGSCSEDNGLTPADKGDGNTTSFLDGQIDPNNNWINLSQCRLKSILRAKVPLLHRLL